ncbi:MAG: hypothetical protein JJU24_10195 [Natronohydrobacter sp.]|nr:hypothetical protein [Natronohydrobacter sp.]
MTNPNPTPGNTPGLPAPSISACHNKAVRLSGVLSAVAHLENENACAEGRSALIFLAEELSAELESALDLMNSSRGQAA